MDYSLTPRSHSLDNSFASLHPQKERSSTSPRRSVSGSSTASTDTAAATTPTSSDDKKKRRKKKKSATGTGVPGTSSNNNKSDTLDSNNTVTAKKSVFSAPIDSDANNPDASADPSQLPLGRRLEIAATHSDIHAALVGLLGWSRLYVGTDTLSAFFDSRALELLLANVFRTRPTADAIFNNLQALLANCLLPDEHDSDSDNDVAAAVVAAVRAVVRTGAASSPSEVVCVDKMAQYVTRMLIQYRLSSVHSTGASTATDATVLAQELVRLDAELTAAAARDGAVQGQTIRETFQRRDIRCDALDLYEARLTTLQSLLVQKEAVSAQVGPQQATDSSSDDTVDAGFAAFASADDDAALAAFDPDELAGIQEHMHALDARKAAALAPLQATRDTASDTLLTLTTQRAELEAQLRALNREIEDQLLAQQAVDEQIAAVADAFETEATVFDAEHAHVLQHFARKERREQVAATFTTLEDAVAVAARVRSDVPVLREKRIASVRQHLEGVLRYFASELPCLQFMRARVAQSETQQTQYVAEAESYRTLGVTAVAKELLAKASALQTHVDEDRQCLEALRARDVELLATVERLLHDAEHADAVAALDPSLRTEVQRHVDYVAKLHTVVPPDTTVSDHSEPQS